ncbi:MAG: DUF58 domain-containing protein [Oscillospiraceae bacterium]|nr:DUF58 domain-containing protein [Oscillospiraceae bacterium]
MIVRKISWLILVCALVCLFLHTGSIAALAFSAVVIVIPLLSLLADIYAAKRITAEVQTAGSVRKGSAGAVTITLFNPTAIPVLNVQVGISVENQLNRSLSRKVISSFIMPKSRKTLTLNALDDYCGRIKVSVFKLKLYDCFGLVGVRAKTEASGHMTVLPDTFDQQINIIPNPHSVSDSEIYAPDRPGNDLSETFQIREYAEGDSPRQIHWKLTGKFDRMIVRDPSMPIIRSVLVFWERMGDDGELELTDAQAEVVVSVCKNLLEQSVQFTVGWNDTDRNLCVLQEIHDMDELVGFIPRILRATAAKEGLSGAYLLRTPLREIPAHIIYIAKTPQSEILEFSESASITVLHCGDGEGIAFDKTNYAQQLAQIDI